MDSNFVEIYKRQIGKDLKGSGRCVFVIVSLHLSRGF